jgi:hypothetical protein
MDLLRGLFHSVMFILGAIIRTEFVKYPNLLILFSWLLIIVLSIKKLILFT